MKLLNMFMVFLLSVNANEPKKKVKTNKKLIENDH